MLTLLLTLTLRSLLTPALAAEPEVVFVSEFQPADPEAAGMAALLGNYLRDSLREYPELSVLGPEDAPALGEVSAQTYLDSCPAGEAVGCAFVVAAAADARWAVTARVIPQADAQQIEVVIIDVLGSREALSFNMLFAVGDDQDFAQGVAELVLGVVRGEEGLEVDIREMGGQSVKTVAIDKQAVARQLEDLKAELGGEVVSARGDRDVERQEYTMDDLAEDMDSDASKP